MRRCPYCGEKIPTDAGQCDHCGKSLRKSKSDSSESPRLTRIDSWQKKSVPVWVMYAVVGVLLFCIVLMIAQGCEKFNTRQPRDAGATRFVKPPAGDWPNASIDLSVDHVALFRPFVAL